MHKSLRRRRCDSRVSIPAEAAPVCTFPSFRASKDSHLACNKMLFFFSPRNPAPLTSLGVCLVYGLRIWPFLCTQLSRAVFFPAPAQTRVKTTPSGLVLKLIFVSVMCSWICLISRSVLYPLDIHFFCKIRNHCFDYLANVLVLSCNYQDKIFSIL